MVRVDVYIFIILQLQRKVFVFFSSIIISQFIFKICDYTTFQQYNFLIIKFAFLFILILTLVDLLFICLMDCVFNIFDNIFFFSKTQ